MSAGALQRDRSPGYPIIALGEALARLAEFDAHFKRGGAAQARVGDAWGIKAKAYTDRIVAALRYFGLMEYQGQGDARLVTVSDEGRRYLRAQRDETRQDVIAGAALRPRQIAKYWSAWGAHRPTDATCLDDLILVNGFSETGARGFLKVYDATISFIKASKPGLSLGRTATGGETGTVIHPTNVDASDTPANEAPRRMQADAASRWEGSGPTPTDEERFVADEGAVVIRFPHGLGSASVDDLEVFFALFIRKARRRAEAQAQVSEGQ